MGLRGERAHRIGRRVGSAGEWVGACFLAAWIGGAVFAVAGPQADPEPPAPAPSAAVQSILDEAAGLAKAKQPQEALAAADRARTAAQELKDATGEAQAQRFRALALQELRRTGAAVAAWREAAAAWERVGDGPGRVEAMATAGFLLWGGQPAEADALLVQALQFARLESKRPLAAATVLNNMGDTY